MNFIRLQILYIFIFLLSSLALSAQQLSRPTDEISLEIQRDVKYQVTGVRYSNGAAEDFRYTIMGVRTSDTLVAAPPKPEFIVKSGAVPDTIGIGTINTVAATITSKNVGVAGNIDSLTGLVRSFSVEVLLSADSLYQGSGTDTLLGTYQVNQLLAANDTLRASVPLQVPSTLSTGWHRLLFVIDLGPNAVVEYNDSTNNVKVWQGYFKPCTITTLTDTINTATCGYANGSIHVRNLSAAGYKYLWQDGADLVSREHLSAGNYTLSITDRKGCVSVSTYTIGDTPPVQAQFSTTPATCAQANASATLSTTSGTAPFTYLWSTGNTGATLSQVNAGYYAYTISDAVGCMAIGSLSLDAIPTPVVALDATDANCGGNNGNINSHILIGTAPYTYAWNTGSTSAQLSGLTEGIYSVTLTDANTCTTTETIQVYSSPALGLTVQSSGSLLVAQAVQGVSPYQFQWSTGSHNNNISNAGGLYTLTVTDANGCTATWSNAQTGVSNINTYGISLTPNPTNGIVRLSYESLPAGALIKIYSLNGDLIIEKPLTNLSNSEVQFDLSNLPNQTLQLVIWSNEQVMLYRQSVVLSK